MPQNENFDLNSPTVGSVFKTTGVLEADGREQYKEAILGAYYDSAEATKGLYIVLPNADIKYFDIDAVDVVPQGTDELIRFDDKGVNYLLRTFYEDDGEWVSKYKIAIPKLVLEKKTYSDSIPAIRKYLQITLPDPVPFFEGLFVYFSEEGESEYVTAINYETSYGTYTRANSSWGLVDPDLDFYETLSVMEMKPEKAASLLEKFDTNRGQLPIKDVEQGSSAPSSSSIMNKE